MNQQLAESFLEGSLSSCHARADLHLVAGIPAHIAVTLIADICYVPAQSDQEITIIRHLFALGVWYRKTLDKLVTARI